MASSTCRLKYSSKGKSSLFKPYIVLGERNYAPISLNIGTTAASADSFTLLYPQSRSPWYPLKWRASLSARLGAWWKKKIYYRRESKGDLSVLQSVGNSLYRLNYPDSKLQLLTLRKDFSLYLSFFFLLPLQISCFISNATYRDGFNLSSDVRVLSCGDCYSPVQRTAVWPCTACRVCIL